VSILLANARLIDPEQGRDGPGALRIEDGAIAAVLWGGDAEGATAARVIDCGGHALSPGFIDLGVCVGEPGARHRESYRSAGAAAAAGGVTTMVVRPDTTPCADDPAIIEFTARRAGAKSPVRVLSLGALTRGCEGRDMAEMGLLADAGAVAFCDAPHVVSDARVMRRCLAYARGLGRLVISHPQDAALSQGGCATESAFSGRLGLPGAPAMAERIGVERDLALAELTGARLHLDCVSTRGSLAALARAKAARLPVTAGVSIHHVALNELDVGEYRTFFKLDPPLRAEEDRAAAAQALAEGLIDVLASHHTPWDEESKRVPFEAAAVGAVGLETLLPAALTLVHAGLCDLPTLIARMTLAPARLLGLPTGRLAVGAPADLCLFDPDRPFVLDRFAMRAKSRNTPFDRRRMTGRVLRSWVAGRCVFDHAADAVATAQGEGLDVA
jgi:dihydroorotase